MDFSSRPHNKIWSFDRYPGSGGGLKPLNQGQNLPDPTTYTLLPLRMVLSNREGLRQWLNEVNANLRGVGIEAVIDNCIQRPYRDDPNAERWKRVSLAVVLWLRNGMSTEAINRMEATGRSMVFADDFVKLLKETLHNTHSPYMLYRKYRSTDINGFSKPSEYVAEIMEIYTGVFGFGTMLPGLDPLHTIADALLSKGYDVLSAILAKLPENLVMVSITEFRSISSTVIELIRAWERTRPPIPKSTWQSQMEDLEKALNTSCRL